MIRILYSHETGPMIKFDGEFLIIEDLNPQRQIKWCMSRLELIGMAFRSLIAAVRP